MGRLNAQIMAMKMRIVLTTEISYNHLETLHLVCIQIALCWGCGGFQLGNGSNGNFSRILLVTLMENSERAMKLWITHHLNH